MIRRLRRFAIAGSLIAASPNVAFATPYDDCILKYMGGSQNKTAAYAIERSCINVTEVNINGNTGAGESIEDNPQAFVGSFYVGSLSAEEGMIIALRNTTKFYVTEFTVYLTNKRSRQSTLYRVDSFRSRMPQGAYLSEEPEPFHNIIKPGSRLEFFVPIREGVGKTAAQLEGEYDWHVYATKGIPGP